MCSPYPYSNNMRRKWDSVTISAKEICNRVPSAKPPSIPVLLTCDQKFKKQFYVVESTSFHLPSVKIMWILTKSTGMNLRRVPNASSDHPIHWVPFRVRFHILLARITSFSSSDFSSNHAVSSIALKER